MSLWVCEKIKINKELLCLSSLPYICQDYLYFQLTPETDDIELMNTEAVKALQHLNINKKAHDLFIVQMMIQLPNNSAIETIEKWAGCCVKVAKVKVM